MEIFNIILIVILVVFIAAGILIGTFKGFTRSLFTVFTNITAGLCALFLARPIVKIFTGLPFFIEQIKSAAFETRLTSTSEGLITVLTSITVAFTAPIIFVMLYILLYFILKIPFYFIYKACNKNNRTPGRLYGALVCALNSIIVFIFLFTPLAGYYSTGLTVAGSLDNLPEESQIISITELVGEPVEINEVFALSLVYASGGEVMFNHLSSIEYADEKIPFSDEIAALSEIAVNAGLLVESTNGTISADSEQYAKAISTSFSDSVILKGVAVEALKVFASEWQSGNINGEWLAKAEKYKLIPVIDKLAEEYISCDAEMIAQDFTTIVSLHGTLSDSELLDALTDSSSKLPANDIIGMLADENLLYEILLALYENPRFNSVLPELSDAGVIFLCEAAEFDSQNAPKNPTSMSDITEADIRSEAKTLASAFANFSAVSNGSMPTDLASLIQLSNAISELDNSFLFGHAVNYITLALIKENIPDFSYPESALESLSDLAAILGIDLN